MADEIVKSNTAPKVGFVNRGSNYATKQARMEKEEAELEALIAEQMGQTKEVSKEPDPKPEVKDEGEKDKVEDKPLSREEETFKKRYGDLRRHVAKLEKEWAEKSTTADPLKLPTSDEDLEAWATKHPDIAAIVETIASKKAQEKFSVADARFKEMDEITNEATRAKSEMTIRKSHDDFDELRESDDFHDWVEEQPKVVQDALYINSDDPASVIRVLDLYKVDKGMTPSARKEKAKDAAKTVNTRTRTTPSDNAEGQKIVESAVAKMSDKEFEANYDAINKAMQNGTFVYDITGGAR